LPYPKTKYPKTNDLVSQCRLFFTSVLSFVFFAVFLLFASAVSFAQKKSYAGQGAVSEIVMASPAEMVGHFDMFFRSKVAAEDSDRHTYWYKIVFSKECSFDFTLFPLFESDRYGFDVFKVENDANFCQARVNQTIKPVKNMEIKMSYHDNDQTETFRSNLVQTRKVPVKAGETVYLVVKSLKGQDHGHIIGLNTCDYGYVLEVDKAIPKSDSSQSTSIQTAVTVRAELSDEEALASIGSKLCPPDGKPVQLGTLNFNSKIEVSNLLYAKGEVKGASAKKITKQAPLPLKTKSCLPQALASSSLKAQNTSSSAIVKTPAVVSASVSQAAPATPAVPTTPKPDIWLKELQPTAATTKSKLIPVRCLVTDAVKASPISEQITIKDELTGACIPVQKTATGEFEFAVEKGRIYKVDCAVMGYKTFDHPVNIYKTLRGEENQFEIKLQPLVAGENFILKNIYFNPNTPVIKDESTEELAKLFTFMKNNPEAIISIEGHTNGHNHIGRESWREKKGGDWAFHGSVKKLSRHRAYQVMSYLVKNGIASSRVKTKGWGDAHELYPNARTMEQRLKNMRVEVVILKN